MVNPPVPETSEVASPTEPHAKPGAAPYAQHLPSHGGNTLVLRGFTLLALATWVIGRGLAETLPGAVVGFDATIAWLLFAGAFLSQFLAIAGGTFGLRLASALLAEPAIAGWLRVVCLIQTTCIVFGVLFSAQPREVPAGPELLALLAGLASSLLLLSGLHAVRNPNWRGPGLVAVAAAFSAGTLAIARFVGTLGSDQANTLLFDGSRALATVGVALSCVAAALALAWLLRSQGLGPRVVGFLFVAISPAWTLKAAQLGPAALLSATLLQLSSDPETLIPAGVISAVQWLCLGGASAALLCRAASVLCSAAVALALLGLSVADAPLGALALALAALLLFSANTGAQLAVSQPTP
jgi:hypothetical protein